MENTENWEAHASAQPEAPKVSKFAKFNPNAASFGSFVPGGQAPPPPPPPPSQPAAPAAVEESEEQPEDKPMAPVPAPAPAPVAAPPPPPAPKPVEAVTKQVAEVSIKEEPVDEVKRQEEAARVLAEIDALDSRDHMNIVFIGHVDAGKSTLCGRILVLTGGVDDRTIEKYEREAKDKNRESWYMAYIMDTNEEERAKGKTVEVGRANFATPLKRYTILDAPGHKNFVPNMIMGASQADVGVLVISARKGEFEAGFERGGQTREHAQLAKTLGVQKLVCAVNKMDDPSLDCLWDKGRYDDIVAKMTPFLRGCGYQPKDLVFLPIAGLMGVNVMERVDPGVCGWYQGPALFEVLDKLEQLPRSSIAPFRMPIMDKYKDMGTIVMGKSEQGIVKVGDKLTMMPNKTIVKVVNVYRDEDEVPAAKAGENLRLRIQGVEEEEISPGFVLSSQSKPVPTTKEFEAQLAILDLLDHKSIFTAGYKCILHLHSIVEECEITKLVHQIDMKTKEAKKTKFVKSGAVCVARIAVDKAICAETFEHVPQLGRFTLRDEGKTIAIGKILKIKRADKKSDD